MISSIGIDIVKIERIKRLIDLYSDKFIHRILSDGEIALLPEANRQIFIAGRFAAKEAIIKAMGKRHNIRYREIEILKDDNGKPYIKNLNEIKERIDTFKDTNLSIHVSITHESDYAVALSVIERELPPL